MWVQFKRPEINFLLESYFKYTNIVILAIILLVIGAFIDVGFVLVIKKVLDLATTHHDQLVHVATVSALTILVVGVLREIVAFSQKYSISVLSNKVAYHLKHQVFEKLLNISVMKSQSIEKGMLATQLNFNIDKIKEFGSSSAVALVRDTTTLFGSLIAIFYINFKLTLLFVVFILPGIFISKYVSHKLRTLSHQNIETQRSILNYIFNIKQNAVCLSMFDVTDQLLEESISVLSRNKRIGIKIAQKTGFLTSSFQLFMTMILSLTIFLFFNGYLAITFGTIASFVYAFARMRGPLKNITKLKSDFEQALVSINNLSDFLQLEEESNGGNKLLNAGIQNIELKNVFFRYNNHTRHVLNDVSLSLKPGDHVLLIGPSGVGKSSLFHVICYFLKQQHGHVLINQTSIAQLNLKNYRKHILLVNQGGPLFQTTLKNNLSVYDDSISEGDCIQVLKNVGLDTWLNELPDGLNTLLGDEKLQISGGQKQKIILARTLLQQCDVLLLDEAFASIDLSSEIKIMEHIKFKFKNKIILSISHRYNCAQFFDRMIMLKRDGQIQNLEKLSGDAMSKLMHELSETKPQALSDETTVNCT